MPVRERILSMGITGSGKTFQWLKLADALRKTGAQFYCIDTDNDINYMVETAFPQLKPANKGNVHVYPVFDWPDYRKALEEIKVKATEKDWFVLDMADTPWETVQRYFTSEVMQGNIGDYFLDVRKQIQRSKKSATSIAREAFDGWMDWSVINKLYFDFMNPVIYQLKCHVYMCTKVQELGKKEDPDVAAVFGPYGIRNSGQKNLGHMVHTILLLMPGKKNWYVKTIKDRAGRKYFDKEIYISFYLQYLVDKANWPVVE